MKHPVTPGGRGEWPIRHWARRGRQIVHRLMAARRAVLDAKQDANREVEAAAHRAIDEIEQALGKRGLVWWDDGSPDLNRHMVKDTPYADWYAKIGRRRPGGL